MSETTSTLSVFDVFCAVYFAVMISGILLIGAQNDLQKQHWQPNQRCQEWGYVTYNQDHDSCIQIIDGQPVYYSYEVVKAAHSDDE